MQYGIPYMGSKSKIARNIIYALPSGERLVDLFGGGFAISHCALLSGKWKRVLYNDIDPLLPPLITDAIQGKYSYDVFTPEWVSREEFHARKATDGYVKYIWSFGNGGDGYMYSEENEGRKRSGFEFVVNGTIDDFIRSVDGLEEAVTATDIKRRRRQFTRFMKNAGDRCDLEGMQQLERLQCLERLERLQCLERLEMTCKDYREYEYREGDVVYCDPPYEGTYGYGDDYESKPFYDWAATRDFEVIFSSYGISDERFYPFKEWDKRSLLAQGGTKGKNVLKTERLYSNRPRVLTRATQMGMFDEEEL